MILRSLLKFISDAFVSLKEMFWTLGIVGKHWIRVLPGYRYRFLHFGDVTKLLYAHQHLVPFRKSFEYSTLNRFVSLLKPGDRVLDIGANVGLYSLLGSQVVGSSGRIFAFEPNPKTFGVLLQNLEFNGCVNVNCAQIALSNRSGKVSLAIPDEVQAKYAYGDSYLSMYPEESKNKGLGGVTCMELDVFLKENGVDFVDIIKIDVEGAEMLCFEGAKLLLSGSSKPVIIMECDEVLCRRFGYSVFDTLKFLDGFGYVFEQFDVHQWIAIPKASN
jgi:FkbM family methyltransferase